MDIKEGAIYQLPNGRELVAEATMENQAVLYSLSASAPLQYRLNGEGRLVCNGQLTAWGVDDLLDTGRFAQPDLTAALVDSAKSKRESAQERNV